MPVKSSYLIDGRRWIPQSHAAALLATNAATIKRMMGDGTLEWCPLRAGSKTFLVDQATVFALRAQRGTAAKEVRRRADAPIRTAAARGVSMLDAINLPVVPSSKPYGIFDRTWDPSPLPLPISGKRPKT